MSDETRRLSDSAQKASGAVCAGAKPKKLCGASLVGYILLIISLALVAGGSWCIWLFGNERLAGRSGANEARVVEMIAPMQERLGKLEQQVKDLEVVRAESPDSGEVEDGTATSRKDDVRKASALREELAQSRKDMAAMAGEIKALKESLRETGDSAIRSQREFRSLMSAAMVLAQMRERASAGYSFANELAAFRASGVSQEGAQASLAALDLHAAQGVPALEVLRRQLAELSGSVAHAIEKAHAQGWWQRVLAALQGLVSIRSEHGGVAAEALERADAALAMGDTGQALAEVAALEPAAREVLHDWQLRLEARSAVDRAIGDLIALSLGVTPAQDMQKPPTVQKPPEKAQPEKKQPGQSSDEGADQSAEQP